MSIADDIRTICERTNRDLDAVHDFFEHSKTVWKSFQILVNQGQQISTTNDATGTVVDQDGLLKVVADA